YHQERLKRKEYAINESINYFLRDESIGAETDSIVMLFDTKICELANINSLDINIYSLSGDMLISSNPELHENHIVPDKLGRTMLNAIERKPEQLLVKRKTDTMEYLSTYDYVHNSNNEPIAIINLPYFDTKSIHEKDQEKFLMRLSQTYFFLFIIAGVIAYFLSNYITSSLKAVGQKLKSIRINETNVPLKWKFDDEIGALVDEYNRMLEELEASAAILAKTERESAWREMAKQVAHEIKNPLTPMRLNVQHLEKTLKTEQSEKLREFTESMISQIDTLSGIAEAFSRFASMPELKSEEFGAREIIQRTAALYPEYNIQFHTEDKDILLKGDKDQLVRVMNNLINNAIQAVPEEREPEIRIGMKKREDHTVLISVSDNGSGIPDEQKDKIFEPRFTTKTKGMGLGLAMVKNIINGFGGEIWFETELGKGTTFYISLPGT
ncbi:MAG TPA: two-component sensor histidine kinase, partial [Cryomorphaceae bacterium]|nr:two-component sensor histidine kinase [Cryomorphaceae bacterium]